MATPADLDDSAAAELPEPLDAWLKMLSVALHKRRAYPVGHPTLVAAEDAVFTRLEQLLADRAELAIGVARGWLIVDGIESEVTNPILRELAERLHRRRLAALVIRPGITRTELGEVLTRLDAPPGDPDETMPPFEHVELVSVRFDRLSLAGEGEDDGVAAAADRRWLTLARAALEDPTFGEGPGGAGGGPGTGGGDGADAPEAAPVDLARAINARVHDRHYATNLLQSMASVGRQAKALTGDERRMLERKLQGIFAALEPSTLQSLAAAGQPGQYATFVHQGIDTLAPDGLLEFLQAAASSSGQSISHYLLRLLRKMALQAQGGPDGGDPDSLRDVAKGLVDQWTLENPNPAAHTKLLEHIASREASALDSVAEHTAENLRLLHMALEVGAGADDLPQCVDALLEARRLGDLLDALDIAADARAAEVLERHLLAPETLRTVLLEEPVELEAAAGLLLRCGPAEAPALLDSLAISESSATRTIIMERLRPMAAEAAPAIVDRLLDAPWYVQRNLLVLLNSLPEVPVGLQLESFLQHAEVSVRLEAVRLGLRDPAQRGEMIGLALHDVDDRIVRLGLETGAVSGLPRTALPRLMQVVVQERRPSELRARAVRLLEAFDSPGVRDWLVAHTARRRGLLRRLRLAQKSPEMLAALGVLAARWSSDPRAADILRLARAVDDPQIRAAAKEPEKGKETEA